MRYQDGVIASYVGRPTRPPPFLQIAEEPQHLAPALTGELRARAERDPS